MDAVTRCRRHGRRWPRRLAALVGAWLVVACADYNLGTAPGTGDSGEDPSGGVASTSGAFASSGDVSSDDGIDDTALDTGDTGDPGTTTTQGTDDGAPIVCTPCPSVVEGASDLARDPRVDGYLRAVWDFRAAVDEAADAYAVSLSGLAEAWGHSGALAPTPANAAALAEHIGVQVDGSVAGTLVVQLTRVQCGADLPRALEEQARCEDELGCPPGDACAPQPTVADVGATCGGVCVGSCGDSCPGLALCPASGEPGMDCPGFCFGTCNVTAQSCLGKCTGACDGQPGHDGFCSGQCTGACDLTQGGTCPGLCTGSCMDDADELSACDSSLDCIGGCSEVCDGACLGAPSMRVAEACGAGSCDAAAQCDATAALRSTVAMQCDPIGIVPCYTVSPLLSDAAAAEFDVRVASLSTHAPALLEAHARLSMAMVGEAPASLVAAPMDPAPALELAQRIDELHALGEDGLDVPCPACALEGLDDAAGLLSLAMDEAQLLLGAGDALRIPLGLD